MRWLDDLEKWFGARVKMLAQPAGGASRMNLLEICKEIQSRIRDKIVAQDRGIRVFPYTRLEIDVFAEDEEQQAAYDAVLNGEEPFGLRVLEMLAEEQCRAPALQVVVNVSVPEGKHPNPFTVRFLRSAPGAERKQRPRARLVVIKGDAETSEVLVESARVNIGRMREVVGRSGAVIRLNDLPFKETETTIAREHAYIRWDADTSRYLLFDYLSGGRGTRLFRDGESILLPQGNSKGYGLQTGDEIHLGMARIRFELLE
jgi:hypothetical protein